MRQYLLIFAIGAVLYTGCEPSQTTSQPATPPSNQATPRIATPGRIWFIKAMGATEPAPRGTTAAIAFWRPIAIVFDSLTFDSEGSPSWTLPPEWSQKTVVEGQAFELAHPSGGRIEIISAPVPDIASEEALKDQLNQWRKELGLELLPEADWTNPIKTGVQKSKLEPRTSYAFQFAQPESAGVSMTILGLAFPHADPASLE